MIKNFSLAVLFILHFCFAFSQNERSIPAGKILGPFINKSKIYPGTEHNYWLYVPAQYIASKPACVMVVEDGLSRATGWNLPPVLDSLISLEEIPVMIGIFIDHGTVPSDDTSNYPRFNRSFEYDALGDRYARFLLEEILPEVEHSYNLSKDPNDRSIAGASSGAICAFNVAWERPDKFRRVLSSIGTYVGLRGGDEFATLVRKTEPKPLRVFLQDGDHDLNIYAGDWWIANQGMLSALTWAGYDVNHAWGQGAHDSKHTITILPDALKWLWKDYPAPVEAQKNVSSKINLIQANEPWKEILSKNIKIEKLAVNKAGEVFFTAKRSVYKINNEGNIDLFTNLKGEAGGISFNDNGKLYVGDLTQHTIAAIDEKGVTVDIIKNVNADYIAISNRGIYFSETNKDRVGFYNFLKKSIEYFAVPGNAAGLAISTEQTFLNVGVTNSVFGFSFKIMPDGTLDFGQEYIHYQIPYGVTSPGTKGLTVDADNLLYSATAAGIQVSDQLGRVNFIFSKPADSALDVKFAGPQFNVLYVNYNGKVFSRKITAKGVLSWLPAVKPPKPGL